MTTSSIAFYSLNEKDSYLSFGYNSDAYELEALTFINPTERIKVTAGLFHRNVYYATNPAELSAAWCVPYGHHLTRLEIDSRIIENSFFTQVNYNPFNKIDVIGGLRLQHMYPYRYQASGGNPLISQGRQHYTDDYELKTAA